MAWTADQTSPITADSGYITADGATPVVSGQMPYVLGALLAVAQTLLQQANVLNLSSLGYFSAWPITVKWVAGTGKIPSTVISQTPSLGTSVAANSAVTLTCAEFPLAVVYP